MKIGQWLVVHCSGSNSPAKMLTQEVLQLLSLHDSTLRCLSTRYHLIILFSIIYSNLISVPNPLLHGGVYRSNIRQKFYFKTIMDDEKISYECRVYDFRLDLKNRRETELFRQQVSSNQLQKWRENSVLKKTKECLLFNVKNKLE